MSEETSHRYKVLDALRVWRSLKTPDRAAVLLKSLGDLYLVEMKHLTSKEKDLLGRMMHELLPQVHPILRAEFAFQVAPVRYFPSMVHAALAKDKDISVAGPVIELSQELDEFVLCEIVRECSNEHVLAVARRVEVPKAVSRALIDTGRLEILIPLAQNSGARFGISDARRLAEKSKKSRKLQEALVRRTDLPEAAATVMTPFLPKELKRELRPNGDIDRASIYECLRELEQMAEAADQEQTAKAS